jgi:uncharacterized membrane protein YkgB
VRWKNNDTLALVIGWIGVMKFTGYEAQGIEPLVAHSPLLSWMYGLWTVRQFAAGLGVVEICVAILIALRPWSRKASAIGAHVLEQTQSEECVLVILGAVQDRPKLHGHLLKGERASQKTAERVWLTLAFE